MQPSDKTFVELRNITKVYPDGTVALRGVSLSIRYGEILGLLGENGAGKTTLMKILSGVLQPTTGELLVEGRRVRFRSPADALRHGIGMVHQHFTLVPNFTVLENIILGIERERQGLTGTLSGIDFESHVKRLEKLMEETELKVPLDAEVQKLSLGLRQRTEILKVLYRGVRLLILDEPTTFLTPLEVEELFKVLRNLKSQGKTVIFITHKIKEALEITDRIVVMRGGRVVGEVPTREASPEVLGELMVGKRMELDVLLRARKPRTEGRPVLEVRGLVVKNDLGLEAVRGVSFKVYPGEIYGIAGVEGNGQAELVEAITGLRKPESGEIVIDGVRVSVETPIDVYRMGISHIPGDRDRYGLVLEFTVKENTIIGRQWERSFTRGLALNWRSIARYAWEIIKRFNIVTPGIDAQARALSGGNRQRLVVGRELSKKPRLIVAAHPTRGLDIASTMYIRELLAEYRDKGAAVLLVSADLDEIFQLSDRIAVMYEGRIVAEMPAEKADRRQIGLLMGGYQVASRKA